MTIAILGAGNMGTAFAKGLMAHFRDPDGSALSLILSDRPERHEALKGLQVKVTSRNVDAVHSADVVILAVKPTDISQLCQEIAGRLRDHALVISLAAGVRLQTISEALSSAAVVRVMPNLLAAIGESMSGWYAMPTVTPEQKKIVRVILQAIGRELEVEREELLDHVTAISGSGPAYVWKFMESMIAAGVKIGLSVEQSKTLTSQTFLGAAKMAALATDEVSALRQRVTSKGGTTEEALRVFEKKGFDSMIEEAVAAAYTRVRE